MTAKEVALLPADGTMYDLDEGRLLRPGQEIPEIVGPDGTLGGDPVVPGFTLSLIELWAELDLIAPPPA